MDCTFNIGPDNVLRVQGGSNVSVTSVRSNGRSTRVTVTCDGETKQFDVPNLAGVVVKSGSSNVSVVSGGRSAANEAKVNNSSA